MDIELLLIPAYPMAPDRAHVQSLFMKYDLISTVREIVHEMESLSKNHIDHNSRQLNLDALILATAPVIKKINTQVGPIGNPSEKYFVKAALGKIFNGKLSKLIVSHMTLTEFDRWTNVLRILCQQESYVFDDLANLLGINEMRLSIIHNMRDQEQLDPHKAKTHKSLLMKDTKKFLEFGETDKLKERLKDKLQRNGYIKSTRGFDFLFKTDPIVKVKMNREFLDEIFILFCTLQKRKIILVRGSRGIWDVLSTRTIDFDSRPLLEIEPKRFMERLSKSKDRLNALRIKSESWINEIVADGRP